MNLLIKMTISSLILCSIGGCSDHCPSPAAQNYDRIETLEIDKVLIHIPYVWRITKAANTRPWRNGVSAILGGWGEFEPRLVFFETPSAATSGGSDIHCAKNTDQQVPPKGDFFTMKISFEFPLPPVKTDWWGVCQYDRVGPSPDQIELVYHAKNKKPLPYLDIVGIINPSDGVDVGDGWREIERSHNNKIYKIRFDAEGWLKERGSMPRRLAASYSKDRWDHFMNLLPYGWAIGFSTQDFAYSRWRAQYATAEALYNWLRTPPAERDNFRRFEW